ncbi:MAG: ornithine cyclodeaminase family protein [Pseudomonadota bacterium]
MRILDGPQIAKVLDYSELIERIAAMFHSGATAPLRHHHAFGENAGTLLLMPAWDRRFVGIKIATVVPGNAVRGIASVQATYLLLDGATGQPRAVLEGRELTLRRTAATSALASRYLSRSDSARLLLVGAGALAPHLARAHALVRPIREIAIWNRTPARAEALAGALAAEPAAKDIAVHATADLAGAVADADIVSTATLATEPILRGPWLKPGQHLDLVGSFRPHMREADDDTLRRASLYCDSREAATKESGDLVGPLERGVIAPADILGDLFDLTHCSGPARTGPDEITLFKSVGHAFEDLAAAVLAFERA